MAKYDVVFSCGHKGTVGIIGKSDYREYKLRWYEESGLCPKCYSKRKEKEKAIEAENDRKLTEELELPELTGTPKQIEWATDLRIKKIKAMLNSHSLKTKIEKYDLFEDFVKLNTARFWIDHRDDYCEELVNFIIKTKKQENTEDKELEKKAKEESILKPELEKYQGAVEIVVLPETVEAKYPKCEEFRTIVKKCLFKWNSENVCWEKQCNEWTGTAEERAAELINRLLSEGFNVMCLDSASVERAIHGDFQRESTKWVTWDSKKEKFIISWNRYRDNDYYDEIKKGLPGAKWNSSEKNIDVPIGAYVELEDFANIRNFSISKKAQQKIKELHENEKIITPIQPKKQIQDKLNDILSSSRDVLDDLKDDEDED